MTPAERLQPYIVAVHRASIGAAPLAGYPAPDDHVQAFRDDPELGSYAREEIARLKQDRQGGKTVAESCSESRIRLRALERMIEAA